MKAKKEDYVLVAFAIILGTIITIIGVIILRTPPEKLPIHTIQEQQPQTNGAPISVYPSTDQNLPVQYTIQGQDKIIQKVEKHPKLSQNDALAKERLLQLLPAGETGGIIYTSPDFQIEYIKAFDLFQVQILTINLQQAKNEANIWFRNEGVSQQGICDFPVDFYLSADVAKQLSSLHMVFSPLPNSC